MVTQLQRKLAKLMTTIPDITDNTKVRPQDVKKVLNYVMKEDEKSHRKPAPPAPIGGISLSAASRKYAINKGTFSRWVKKGLVPELMRTNREVYIDESTLIYLVERYRKNPGQGKRSATPEHDD